jgi:hypothetical protein
MYERGEYINMVMLNLIRHPEKQNNHGHPEFDSTDIPLTAAGEGDDAFLSQSP